MVVSVDANTFEYLAIQEIHLNFFLKRLLCSGRSPAHALSSESVNLVCISKTNNVDRRCVIALGNKCMCDFDHIQDRDIQWCGE